MCECKNKWYGGWQTSCSHTDTLSLSVSARPALDNDDPAWQLAFLLHTFHTALALTQGIGQMHPI
jgi:hypothetical protein